MPRRSKEEKNPFDKLEEDWMAKARAAETKDLDSLVRDAACSLIALKIAKKSDSDIKALTEQLKAAREVYDDGEKTNMQKINYLIDVLRARGVHVSDWQEFLPQSQKRDAEEAAETLTDGSVTFSFGPTVPGGE